VRAQRRTVRRDFWDIILEDQSESEEERTYHTANFDGGIGYIQVREFPANASFLDGLADKVKDSKAVIVDLRGCPGGAVDTLKSFSGHFLAETTVMHKMVERKKIAEITAKPRNPNFSGPLIIMIDSRTGSAGEAFARFFQSAKGALVVGDAGSPDDVFVLLRGVRCGENRILRRADQHRQSGSPEW